MVSPTITRNILWVSCVIALLFCANKISAQEESVKKKIAAIIALGEGDEQTEAVLALKKTPSPEIVGWLEKWKQGVIYIYEAPDGTIIPVIMGDKIEGTRKTAISRFSDDSPVLDESGEQVGVGKYDLDMADTNSKLRRAMSEVESLASLADPDPEERIKAIVKSAIGQRQDKLPALLELQKIETESKVKRALEESIALINLRSDDADKRLAAAELLGKRGSLAAFDILKTIAKESKESGDKKMEEAALLGVKRIEAHISRINAVGTLFRGVSSGSVLLVVAIGLAITFGLMGIINMAHGEFIAVGAYTAYMVQNIFGTGIKLSPFGQSITIPGFGFGEFGMSLYFAVAIPLSFIVAALVGLLLERSVIQFLYRRPLESLLATWGVSLVMQQLFRLIFGPNNVQVSSPVWLSGNWTVNDVVFGWNRLFVIGFAILIIVATWLVLNKTSLGLLIRSVMQNRNMAACMGVRTERVNMMTFAFGCGLAGLAGAFLSQISNVGPSLGQNYIVDAFMTVVVGGVGNILGTVVSALGIGMADQGLQQYLGNPVIGKILVLALIILFLQWRPQGLFVTRSRSLD
ncbi:MAG: urea ABC transporter permease subunit UrtB [Akkermansiaceae bacterium]|jgi:urea transport system permease protein|nr:urea ABC transporter permease subunit UrtB [Akkermansiaceae bacterium]MDP4648089.1 urea ABC transporter permease subunit UrtB [Akkermansiaceae bacterium]MDP4720829.1 urea ABC transporter permease subunit UrtB [Akkermansiaceae bacterium]MDP4780641.1 urea ABC transporter permease subunit UrtB [Akkermansiaceae bacterium]MDP4848477.1 urea ABC transporter permease subunit UrtB [Akkermansiaceae bacterium]